MTFFQNAARARGEVPIRAMGTREGRKHKARGEGCVRLIQDTRQRLGCRSIPSRIARGVERSRVTRGQCNTCMNATVAILSIA